MTRFPEPPSACGCSAGSAIRACSHDLKALFKDASRSGMTYGEVLEAERRKWHPDRFSSVPASAKQEMQAKATALFQIISLLIQERERENLRG